MNCAERLVSLFGSQAEVARRLRLDRAVRGHQIAKVERERRAAIGGGVAVARNLLVLELGILEHLEQVEVDPRAVDVARRRGVSGIGARGRSVLIAPVC